MIRGILDNDLYKFTMQQAVRERYPEALAEYRFFDRGKTAFPKGVAGRIRQAVDGLAGLALSGEEKAWLGAACPFFTPSYLDFLSAYRFDPGEVAISREGPSLDIRITGPWYRTILWEVPLMAVISESCFDLTRPPVLPGDEIRERNRHKAIAFRDAGLSFVDFGTRRRFSAQNHAGLIRDLLSVPGNTLAGTSNVHLARQFNITPIGTMAHEWIMFHGALAGFEDANPAALDAWAKVFGGELGIALTDTFTTRLFLKGFDQERASFFTGVRQDSGDPFRFIDEILAHYQGLGIDPAAKVVVFSDGLDPDRAIAIHRACRGRIRDVYGIGTNLTNDVGAEPLNMVIKMTRCRPGPHTDWQPTVKLSDDKGKHTGDPDAVNHCLAALGMGGG